MQEINKDLLQYINGLGEFNFVQIFVQIFVDAPIFIIPIFLLLYWIVYSRLAFKKNGYIFEENIINKKQDLLYVFYGIILAIIISLTIQQFINIDRPEQHIKAGGKLLLDHLPDASFPSDHATVSIAFITGILLAGYKKLFFIILIPFIFMNFSRIIAGVHWPFDVLAGSIIGIFSSIIVFNYIKKIKLVKNINLKIIKLLNYIKL